MAQEQGTSGPRGQWGGRHWKNTFSLFKTGIELNGVNKD